MKLVRKETFFHVYTEIELKGSVEVSAGDDYISTVYCLGCNSELEATVDLK